MKFFYKIYYQEIFVQSNENKMTKFDLCNNNYISLLFDLKTGKTYIIS